MQTVSPQQIVKIEITMYLRLQFESGHHMMVETPGIVRSPDGSLTTVDPTKPPTLLPILELMRTPIDNVTFDDDAPISLEFSDGSTVRFDPHPRWESWTLWDPSGVGLAGAGPI